MYDDQSKRYENIDALIKAAEVLERNEILSKSKKTLESNKKVSCNIDNTNETSCIRSKKKLVFLKDKKLSRQSNERFSDSLMQTLECIRELRNDERWYLLLESKLKSDNRALCQELNHLKRKLYKIKHMGSTKKKQKSIDNTYEDEDTSTASEDEDYNKYDSKPTENTNDVADDVTDDASECEEISQFSKNKRIYGSKHITHREINRSKSLCLVNNLIGSRNISAIPEYSRRHISRVSHLSELAKTRHPCYRNAAMTMSNSIWNNCNIPNARYAKSINFSQYGLIPSPDCKVSSKVHRIT